ncbi:MAG TPA: bifunctional 4-hydroxy-2-oxoglutarate aldolase/2-dehydro-3-deoxy-phosphogluconate aldolase [Symbiobacteriaceae bacterium]
MNDIQIAMEASGVVAILRGLEPDAAIQVARALHRGGISFIEITFPSPGSLDALRALAELPDVVPGMGTVMSPAEVDQVKAAGARFIVAPNTDRDVICRAKALGLFCAPGAMTPSEAVMARRWGADMVKIFPASVVTPTFFREMQGPCPDIPLMATGGITLDNAHEFIKAGARVVGLGGALANKKLIAQGRYDVLEEKARTLVARVRAAKGNA